MDPPVDDDVRPKIGVRYKSYTEAISRDGKPVRVNTLKQPAVGCLVQKCMRCGDSGHAHDYCTSMKPTWGKDWRKHRERRKHRKGMRRLVKTLEGDVGVKTCQSICEVRQPTMSTAAASVRCNGLDEDQHQSDETGIVTSSKKLCAVIDRELETSVTVDSDPISGLGLDKVLDGPLRLCGACPSSSEEGGAGAGKWTRIDDRSQELEDPNRYGREIRRLQEVERLKEVAQIG